MTVFVSIVVPTFKRPELLSRCLAALLAQDFDPAAYEIIVVDDAACPETERLVRQWAGQGNHHSSFNGKFSYLLDTLTYTVDVQGAGYQPNSLDIARTGRDKAKPAAASFLPRTLSVEFPVECASGLPRLRYLAVHGTHGPAAARNCGWRAAQGEIIAFTDDDCIPQPDWLKCGVAAFTAGVMGASGRVIVPLTPCPTDYERDAAGLEKGEFVTANCFYRRTALAAVGGFDERFTVAWREDSDLFFTLLKTLSGTDYTLVCAPGAVVVHPIRSASWGISLRQQRKSMFNALLYKKHPDLYRRRLPVAQPRHYYVIVTALLAALAAAALGAVGLAWLAAGLWGLLTGSFCAWRLRHTARTPAHIAEMMFTSILIPPLSIFWRIAGAVKFKVIFL